MGVHVFNASVIIHNIALHDYTLEATATEVHADGSAGGPARALVFSTKLLNVKSKILKSSVCLGEAACSLLVEGTVKADVPLNVEVSTTFFLHI